MIKSIKPDTTSWKRQVTIQVIASDTPSGIVGYSFNDGATWTSASTYTTTKNGTYKIKVKDYANNITSGQITINNIDRTGPKCVSSGGNNTWTNQSRTIIGTCIDDGEGAGCETRTVSKTISTDTNAKMSPGIVKDIAGNETTCPATEMVKVDKTKPSCTVTLSTTNWTNKAVTAYGKCKDSLSGCATNDVKKKYSSEMNAKVTIGTVRDKAGNETNCTSSQNVKIDKTAPTCTSTGGSTAWTSGSRTVTGKCSDTGGSGCKGNISYTYNAAVNTNWSINNAGAAGAGKGGTVYDNAGNSGNCPANQPIRLDRKKPSCTSSGGSSNWVVGGSLTITGKCSDDGSGCKGNATKTFYPETDTKTASPGIVYDNVGNSAACPANQEVHVTNKLDAPIITNPTNGNWVNYNYALTVKTPNNKVSVAYWQWKSASTNWTTYSNSAKNTFTTTQFTTEKNETVYVRYCLSNGVCSPEASTMIRIDKTAPRWTVTMHRGAYTNKAGQTSYYTCYAAINYVDNRSVDSGLGWRRNITGNSGSVIGNDVNFNGPKLPSLNFSDIDVLGSFGAYYVSYGFTICDMAGNCATQGRTTGYC